MKIDRSYYDENKHLELLPGHEWALVSNDNERYFVRITIPTIGAYAIVLGQDAKYCTVPSYHRTTRWDYKKPFNPDVDGLPEKIPMTQIEAVNFVYELAKTKMVWCRCSEDNETLSPYWCCTLREPEKLEWSTDLETWNQFVK